MTDFPYTYIIFNPYFTPFGVEFKYARGYRTQEWSNALESLPPVLIEP